MLVRSTSAGEGLGIATQSVVQHGPDVAVATERSSLAPVVGVRDVPPEHLRGRLLVTPPGDEEGRGVLHRRLTRHGGDRVGLRDQGRRGVELTGVHVHRSQVREWDRELAERAGVTRELHRVRRQVLPQLVLPQLAGEQPRQPEPVHAGVAALHAQVDERPQRLADRADRRRVAGREPRRRGIQQQVRRTGRGGRGRGGGGDGRDLLQRLGAEATGEDRRAERLEVGVAGRGVCPAARAGGPRRAAAGRPRARGCGRRRSAPGAGRGRPDRGHRAGCARPARAARRWRRVRRPRTRPGRRRWPVGHGRPGRRSARPPAPAARRRRRRRRGPVRPRPSARDRWPRRRPGWWRRGRDATLAGRDRTRDRSPPPRRGARPDGRWRCRPDRRPIAPGGAGSARGSRRR